MSSAPGQSKEGKGVASEAVTTCLVAARKAIAEGQPQQAEQQYLRLLAHDSGYAEALTFLATAAMRRREYERAVALLQTAAGTNPSDPQILKNLGVALEAAGDAAGASVALERALQLAPDHYPARLHLASLYEREGRGYEGLTTYYRAVTTAQLAGQWLNEATTPRWLREKVRYAIEYIHKGRTQLFHGCLQTLAARYGASELTRVRAWLDLYLEGLAPESSDPRQRPKFLYFPGVPSQPYYGRGLFPFIDGLEAATKDIREEMLACVHGRTGIEPFLGVVAPDQVGHYLATSKEPPSWDAFFFYRHGESYPDNAARCPRTAAVLAQLPQVQIRDHAPEICFSFLTPGTHILPHHGVTNTRLVLHLPLLVPAGCELVVGGESHAWREGECVAFDDTYLHEAWNRGDGLRAVLIMDVWNPHLTDVERLALTDLVATIGDFNRASGL